MKLNDRNIAGLFISIGVAQFFLLLLLSEILYPGYSVHSNYISDLGVGSTAPIFNTSIIIFGLLLLAAAHFLRKGTKDSLVSILMAIVGIAVACVGIFPETTGAPHLLAAAVAFVVGGIIALITFRIAKAPLSYISAILGVITLVAFFSSEILGTTFGFGHGGIERIVVYPIVIWAMLLGGYLLNESNRKSK